MPEEADVAEPISEMHQATEEAIGLAYARLREKLGDAPEGLRSRQYEACLERLFAHVLYNGDVLYFASILTWIDPERLTNECNAFIDRAVNQLRHGARIMRAEAGIPSRQRWEAAKRVTDELLKV